MFQFRMMVLALSFLVTPTWAQTELLWIHFQLNHSYSDLETSCTSFRNGTSLYFAAEIENQVIKSASFHNTHWGESRNKSVKLGLDTLKQIELFQDTKGNSWIKKLPLDSELLRWVLFHVPRGTSIESCLLPQPLKKISPNAISFEFSSQDLEEFRFATSKRVTVTGERRDGSEYSAKIQLVEQPFQIDRL